MIKSREHHGFDDAVDILLRELGEHGGSGASLAHQAFEIGDALFREGCGTCDHHEPPTGERRGECCDRSYYA